MAKRQEPKKRDLVLSRGDREHEQRRQQGAAPHVRHTDREVLDGHGYFQMCLWKNGESTSKSCFYLPGVIDDAELAFFTFKKRAYRRYLVPEICSITPNNIVGTMICKE